MVGGECGEEEELESSILPFRDYQQPSTVERIGTA